MSKWTVSGPTTLPLYKVLNPLQSKTNPAHKNRNRTKCYLTENGKDLQKKRKKELIFFTFNLANYQVTNKSSETYIYCISAMKKKFLVKTFVILVVRVH
jgi:hypothetical protein